MANSDECPLDPRISEALTMLFAAHFDGDEMRILAAMRNLEFLDSMAHLLSDHPKPATDDHLKTGQR